MSRVLVVEDIPENRSTYQIALNLDGHTVDVAGTRQDALERLDRRTYHVGLLDIRLDARSETNEEGLDILKAIHESGEGTAAVMLSGHGTLTSAIAAYEKYKLYRFLRKEDKHTSDVNGIRQAIRDAAAGVALNLFGRYGSLTTILGGSREDKDIWEHKALTVLQPGGINGLSKALNDALKAYLPVLPRRDHETSRFDEAASTLELSLWSKAEAKAIRVVFRKGRGELHAAERGGARGYPVETSVEDDAAERRMFVDSIWK